MKTKSIALLLLSAPIVAGILGPTAGAKDCSQPLKQCLFSDGAGCSIECPDGTYCLTRSAYCSFGFGVNAVCKCVVFKHVTPQEL